MSFLFWLNRIKNQFHRLPNRKDRRRHGTRLRVETLEDRVTPTTTVTGITPALGSTLGGVSVTITGTNFDTATEVDFGNAIAAFSHVDDTHLIATSPSGLPAGVVDVTVVDPNDGPSALVPADQFTYVDPTTAAVGVRITATIHGFFNGGGSVTQVAGGGPLNGATSVYTENNFDPVTGNYSGAIVNTAADGVSTLDSSLTGNDNAGNLTETLTVTAGTGAFAGAAGGSTDQGTSINGVVLLHSSGTLYLTGVGDSYNAADWNDQITGATIDNGAGLTGVGVSLLDTTTGNYWNGVSFAAGSETFLNATLGAGETWSLAVPHAALTDGHSYTVHSQATDSVGNVEPTPGTTSFVYDTSAPCYAADAPVLDPGSDSGVAGDAASPMSPRRP